MVSEGEAVRQPASVDELNRSSRHSCAVDIVTLTKRCSDVHARNPAQTHRVHSTKVNKQGTQTVRHILTVERKEEETVGKKQIQGKLT